MAETSPEIEGDLPDEDAPSSYSTSTPETRGGGSSITAPGAAQTYGALTHGGPAVSRSFTFTANGSCGDTLVAVLKLQDGSNSLGTVTALNTIIG